MSMLDDLPLNHFGVILADPPWRFKTWGVGGNGRACPYPTMGIEEIKSLPVCYIAAPDCLLVMWTTAPFLEISIDVMREWGAKFSTAGAWDKRLTDGSQAIGTGYRWRSSCEFWIAGTYGHPPRARGLAIPNCIVAPRREHSRKPDRLHADLEAMFPGVPKCELFARQRRRGWDSWGNELDCFPEAAE